MFADDELVACIPPDALISHEAKVTGKILVGAFKRVLARSTEEGSRTIVHAVATPEPQSLHGQYITACRVAGQSEFLGRPEGIGFRTSLWEETIRALSKVEARVGEIVKAH
ncbi:hypothetical protein R3P38DRAFT_3491991 [Favolaschia claudopus]|uniref:Uncharacterized protein n=1 Tax=Favolaschia claudopus TaxID=2862362 RepID=A0AAW0EAT7_9AGAR